MNYQELTVHMITGREIPTEKSKSGVPEPEINDVTIRLSEPTFDQFRGAMLAMETPSGGSDRLAAGNFFMTVCIHDQDRDKLDVIIKDPKAHASAAFEAAGLLKVYRAELKKK